MTSASPQVQAFVNQTNADIQRFNTGWRPPEDYEQQRNLDYQLQPKMLDYNLQHAENLQDPDGLNIDERFLYDAADSVRVMLRTRDSEQKAVAEAKGERPYYLVAFATNAATGERLNGFSVVAGAEPPEARQGCQAELKDVGNVFHPLPGYGVIYRCLTQAQFLLLEEGR